MLVLLYILGTVIDQTITVILDDDLRDFCHRRLVFYSGGFPFCSSSSKTLLSRRQSILGLHGSTSGMPSWRNWTGTGTPTATFSRVSTKLLLTCTSHHDGNSMESWMHISFSLGEQFHIIVKPLGWNLIYLSNKRFGGPTCHIWIFVSKYSCWMSCALRKESL